MSSGVPTRLPEVCETLCQQFNAVKGAMAITICQLLYEKNKKTMRNGGGLKNVDKDQLFTKVMAKMQSDAESLFDPAMRMQVELLLKDMKPESQREIYDDVISMIERNECASPFPEI